MLIFSPSIIFRKENIEPVEQYKKAIKYNNRAIITILYIYNLIYYITSSDGNEKISELIYIMIISVISTIPDVIILYIVPKISFKLWINNTEKYEMNK
jgi:archaellum biogenesis protein FlaJ (TadC family)